ncbi:MAG TPA: hypothetical protein EYQ61_11110 [Dehalococcoidia bacterium]|nr:hypothetical protein [Dehalococcoidia bacterium]HIK88374.1 hypothetical protein [Dehalococcoidia bacterium]
MKWSSVLKILDPRIRERITGHGAVKEIEALKSGDLELIDTALRPAPVFELTDQGDESYALWMKDLSDGVQPPWTGEQFIESARHIGQFNGLWSEHDHPTGGWITTDMSADRRSGVLAAMGDSILSLGSKVDHPSIRRLVEGVGMDRMLRLVEYAGRLIDSTRGKPRTVAHNDCHARNLFPVEENGERITYAVDWSSTGLAPVGVDAGFPGRCGDDVGPVGSRHYR